MARMGSLIDIGSPVQDAVVQGSVVQNLGGYLLLGVVYRIHPTQDVQGTSSESILNTHRYTNRLGVRPESRRLGLRILGFVRF